jgi:hypothetical protein
VDDLEGAPPGGGHMCEESGDDVWDGFVQDRHNGHSEHPKLESDKNNIFSLGVVQVCRGPVEGNQAFTAKHYVGTSVAQSLNLYLGRAIDINRVDPSKLLMRAPLQDHERDGFRHLIIAAFVPN